MRGTKQPTSSYKTIKTQPFNNSLRRKNDLATRNKASKSKYKIIIISLAFVVLVIGLGFGLFIFNGDKSKSDQKLAANNSSSNTSGSDPIISIRPLDVTSKVKEYVTTKYDEVMKEGSELTGEQVYFKSSEQAPYWMVNKEKFYVNYMGDGASDISIYFSYNWQLDSNIKPSKYSKVTNAIIESLINQGFIKDTTSIYGDKSYYTAYIKDDVLCTVNTPYDGPVNPPTSLYCGQLSKYTKSLDNYKTNEVFAVAYERAGILRGGDVSAMQRINTGWKQGYYNAYVSLFNAGEEVGGALGLFYKTPTSDWTFLLGTQQGVSCDRYNTIDSQYAFADEECYDLTKTDSNANTTVGIFYNLSRQ